ncbi:O-antigen polymerase [Lonepinella sp. BR2882]|uniref:O-antigen polymerase n=1 Tax=Lonepinella sp. BR2882 TaxID=3095283 RepID=UPI003F6E103C
MRKIFINPFMIYAISFSIAILLYHLGWSNLYLPLSDDFLLFILFTIFFSVFLGVFIHFLIKDKKENVDISRKNVRIICFFILVINCAEFLYSKQIPLLSVLLGSELDYKEFGIPSFHVFVLPYTSAFAVLSYYRFIYNKNRRYYFIAFLFSCMFLLLIMNRGAFLIVVMSAFLMSLYKNYSVKLIFKIFVLGLVILYSFGVLGNKRMLSSGYQDELAVLAVAEASDEFRSNFVPNEYFWGYLYSTVSIANLDNQIKLYSEKNGVGDFFELVALDVLPDFISKRILSEDRKMELKPDLIKEELTTSTMFGQAVKIQGVFGAVCVFIWFSIFCFFTTILSSNQYRIPILSLLSILGFFSIFSNMLVFSGLLLQVFLILFLQKVSIKYMRLI